MVKYRNEGVSVCRPVRWLLALSLIAGCSGGSRSQRGSTAGAAPVTVSLAVIASSADETKQRVLQPAEALRSGDMIALAIKVDHPATLYVAQGLPSGKLEMLFSHTAEQKLSPGQPLLIPSQGQWLQPRGDTPDEDLFVVASTRPFVELEPELCQSLKRSPCSLAHDDGATATRGGDDKPPPPPPPPPNVDVRDRERGYSLQARSDKRGVAVLHFVLRHQR